MTITWIYMGPKYDVSLYYFLTGPAQHFGICGIYIVIKSARFSTFAGWIGFDEFWDYWSLYSHKVSKKSQNWVVGFDRIGIEELWDLCSYNVNKNFLKFWWLDWIGLDSMSFGIVGIYIVIKSARILKFWWLDGIR